jgi:acyl carrier protein
MDKTAAKLEKCFLMVFPELVVVNENIQDASAQTVARWDSLTHVTLLSLIGEEFAISVDFEEFEGATSFSTILDRLRSNLLNA